MEKTNRIAITNRMENNEIVFKVTYFDYWNCEIYSLKFSFGRIVTFIPEERSAFRK